MCRMYSLHTCWCHSLREGYLFTSDRDSTFYVVQERKRLYNVLVLHVGSQRMKPTHFELADVLREMDSRLSARHSNGETS